MMKFVKDTWASLHAGVSATDPDDVADWLLSYLIWLIKVTICGGTAIAIILVTKYLLAWPDPLQWFFAGVLCSEFYRFVNTDDSGNKPS